MKLEELTLDQKIGMTLLEAGAYSPSQTDDAIERIKKRALGTVWMFSDNREAMKDCVTRIREAADYPVLIIVDAEKGYGEYVIGRQITLGYIDDTEATYRFARAMGAAAKADGYNGICSPILDVGGVNTCSPTRMFGSDKEMILRHAEAFIRGFHDAGLLAIVKHYPSVPHGKDTHLFEGKSDIEVDELINNNLYSYIELNKKGLLDGIMTSHMIVSRVDPDNSTTVSKKVIDIIREKGFEGIIITDDMSMEGICAKYGEERHSLALAAGNDIILEWSARFAEASIRKALNEGKITEETIDKAVTHIINTQNKIATLGNYQLQESDKAFVDDLNRRSVIAHTEDGLTASIPTDEKYLFVVMTKEKRDFKSLDPTLMADTTSWLNTTALIYKIKEDFPHSEVAVISEYPDREQMLNAVLLSRKCKNTVFVYYTEWLSYVGGESINSRIYSLADSILTAKRSDTLVFFGNPNMLLQLPHFPRVIAGTNNRDNTLNCIDVLAGKLKADGKFPYDVGYGTEKQ